MNYTKLDIRSSVTNFVIGAELRNPTALTLTMKMRANNRSIDTDAAQTNFRHFIKRLSSKSLGSRAKRYGELIRCFPIIEKNAEGRLHYHALIERPDHVSLDKFASEIGDHWSKTEFGYDQIDVQPANNGWIDYMLKTRQKAGGALDAIDWTNCNL